MSVIVVLIGFSILVAGGFLLAFLWAVRSGQYDDRYTPSIRILFDDHPRTPRHNHQQSHHDKPPAR
ncbi:cbb3-type cytochrome oxidase assembly protein CcoS [bacterium]|nr:cbb3-type cytochrome oxidase assembly protein CcoS [bacterium]